MLAGALGTANLATRWMDDHRRHRVAKRCGRLTRLLALPKWRAVQENLDVINKWAGTHYSPDQVFENFAVTLSDFLSQAKVTVEVEGREKAEEARRHGHGVIFLTSHLGHWELGGRVLADWGWPATAIYKPYGSVLMQKFIQRRRAPGLKYLAVGKGAAFGVTRALNHHETVAFLGDRPFGEDGAIVTMCGRKARLPRGPFLFACRHQAPVIPGFVLREKPGFYRAVVEDPIWPTGEGPESAEELLRKTAKVLENYISRHGDQWYCFEPAWETNGGHDSP